MEFEVLHFANDICHRDQLYQVLFKLWDNYHKMCISKVVLFLK